MANYRNQLIERGERPSSDGGLSTSTIRHRASHLAGFFRWLCTQDGYRRLGASLPEYFALPRKQMAKTLPPPTKEYPTIDDAEDMISSMPRVTRLQRRDKAIVACAFLTVLRAAALLSMKLKHLNTEARMAVQDGREMHAKNGKSFTVRWFPVPESFAHCVVAWKKEISALGFGPDDALFPAGMYLTAPLGAHDNVPVLLTTDPITRAFQQTCSGTGNHYTPHAARHCLKALGDRICTTSQALKAWSLNLGHDSLVTTETYYGKMTDVERMQILDGLSTHEHNSDEELKLMLSNCLHELARGTPEFKRNHPA